MTIKNFVPILITLAFFVGALARAEEKPKTSNEVETAAERQARIDYNAAKKAANAAEAATLPLKVALQKADATYAEASKEANAKRQKATQTKNLSGESGAEELKQAEAAVPVAVKALEEATKAKPVADKALADAKSAALPLQQAYDLAEKAAKEAEAKARVASNAANQSEIEAKRTAVQAAALRRAAEAAETALAQMWQEEEQLKSHIALVAKKLAKARKQSQKKSTDVAAKTLARLKGEKETLDASFVSVQKRLAASTKAFQAAEQAALTAEEEAEGKNRAALQAAAKRAAVADAQTSLFRAQKAKKQAQAGLAAKKLTDVQKKVANKTLGDATKRLIDAKAALAAARKVAKELVELDATAKQATAEAAEKRKAARAAAAALTPKQKALEQATMQARSAAQKLSQAESRRKSAEAALASLKKAIAAAKETHVADEKAAKEAEAIAAPLKEAGSEARKAYTAARKIADEKQTLAQEVKNRLYRLIAARRVASLMESPNPPKPANRIDEIVFAKLKALNIKPALCSDAVFIRRAFLDLTGKLPTAAEARTFIRSTDPKKRVALIDRLLEETDHFDYWAMKWSDILRIKAEFPVKVWPNAAQAYHRWVWESIAKNKPYDQFARELLTSSGSNFRVGPVNFYRAIQNKTPEGIAGAVGLAFMGARIHSWPEDRRAGMAVFFSQVGYKPTSEWKEEIIFWDPLHSTAVPGSIAPGQDAVAKGVTVTNQIPQAFEQPMEPNGPLAAVFPNGVKTTIPPNRDPREVFADWLIRPENPWFAGAIVNRTWAWAMGRGIVQEADDIREDNPPSNPELLAYLEKELVSSGYDLNHLKRLIFTSTVYQFSSLPKSDRPEAAANFARTCTWRNRPTSMSRPPRRCAAPSTSTAWSSSSAPSNARAAISGSPASWFATGESERCIPSSSDRCRAWSCPTRRRNRSRTLANSTTTCGSGRPHGCPTHSSGQPRAPRAARVTGCTFTTMASAASAVRGAFTTSISHNGATAPTTRARWRSKAPGSSRRTGSAIRR